MIEQNNNKYITLYHFSRRIKTLAEFMEREKFHNDVTLEDFFELNRERIFVAMDLDFRTRFKEERGLENLPTVDDLYPEMEIPCPIEFIIQASKVNSILAISQTNVQAPYDDVYQFANEQIEDIISDPGFRVDYSVDTVKSAYDNNVQQSFMKLEPNVKAFGWFKAASNLRVENPTIADKPNGVGDYKDLTKFIISCATTVTRQGGSFTMRLPVLPYMRRQYGILDYRTETVEQTYYGLQLSGTNDGVGGVIDGGGVNGIFAKAPYVPFNKGDGMIESSYATDISYFEWLISTNDLIFIAFEKLEMENKYDMDRQDARYDDISIATNLSGFTYDMIALVDTVSAQTDHATGQKYIEVTGRDLMKLLLDDGSFFFDVATSSRPNKIFDNYSTYRQGDILDANTLFGDSNPVDRLRRVNAEINVFASYINADLSYVLKGVISRLANVAIVPDWVLESWAGDRTTFVDLEPDNEPEQ